MSGHSKWSTIKHKKAILDSARGKLFSKLSRAIMIAIKTGGGPDPNNNYKLRMAIDAAKSANMPKVNIERVLKKAENVGNLVEVRYEGFVPGGGSVIVEAVTDNKMRTIQEIKKIFEKSGGQFANTGAVSFNFEAKGRIIVKKRENVDTQMLELIDLGVEDVVELDDGIEIFVDPKSIRETREALESGGHLVVSASLIQKPITLHKIESGVKMDKALSFIKALEDNDSVQNVFTDLDMAIEK